MTTKCGHLYHFSCIIETLSDGTVRSCPLCRTDIRNIADHSTCSGQVFRCCALLLDFVVTPPISTWISTIAIN